MKPDHLFVNGPEVTLLDVDSFRLGDPVYDIAMLLQRLRFMRSPCLPRDLDRCRDAYFAAVPPDWKRRLPAQTAYADLQLARSQIQHQRPRWRHHVHWLVRDASQQIRRIA